MNDNNNDNYISLSPIGAKTPQLPAKLSDCIIMAVMDLMRVEAQPRRYEVAMNSWHDPMAAGPCMVCLAGSLIAMAGNSADECLTPADFPDAVHAKLLAIDSVRKGEFEIAALQYYTYDGVKMPATMREISHELNAKRPLNYDKYPAMFKAWLLEAALKLAAVGL